MRDRSSGRGTIGVGIGRNLKNTPNLVSKDIFTASKIGFDTTVGLLKLTWIALVNAISTGTHSLTHSLTHLLTHLLTYSHTYSGFSGNEIGGPIAIVKAGAELAHTSSVALIQFMISLSVNLAVLNALPVPALDGGQLALVAVEKIRNKKLPRRYALTHSLTESHSLTHSLTYSLTYLLTYLLTHLLTHLVRRK